MTTQYRIIREFAEKIPNHAWAEGARGINNMSDLDRLQRVKALIEDAFVIASYTPNNNDTLFALAALPHDTGLDEDIRKGIDLADSASGDTLERHQKTEGDHRRFI